jgi:hypothetical protein
MHLKRILTKFPKGNVLIITLPIIIIVSFVGIELIRQSGYSRRMGTDRTVRCKTFHVADGAMAVLCQELLYSNRSSTYALEITKNTSGDSRFLVQYGVNGFTPGAQETGNSSYTKWVSVPDSLSQLPRLRIDTTQDAITTGFDVTVNRKVRIFAVCQNVPNTSYSSTAYGTARASNGTSVSIWKLNTSVTGSLLSYLPKISASGSKKVINYVFLPDTASLGITYPGSPYTVKYWAVPYSGSKFLVQTIVMQGTNQTDQLRYVLKKFEPATPGLPFGNNIFSNAATVLDPEGSVKYNGSIFINGDLIMLDPPCGLFQNWAQIVVQFGYRDASNNAHPCVINVRNGTVRYISRKPDPDSAWPCNDWSDGWHCTNPPYYGPNYGENITERGEQPYGRTISPEDTVDYQRDHQFFINYIAGGTWYPGLTVDYIANDRWLNPSNDSTVTPGAFPGGVVYTTTLPSTYPDDLPTDLDSVEKFIAAFKLDAYAQPPGGIYITNATKGSYNLGNLGITEPRTGGSGTSAFDFYDLNCYKKVTVTEINMATFCSDPGGQIPPNFNGVLYIDLRNSAGDLDPGEINAVRITNAKVLSTAKLPKGLLIVTPQPLYIKGSFNHPDSLKTGQQLLAENQLVNAGIVADAITVLSTNWDDSRCKSPADCPLAGIYGPLTAAACAKWPGGVNALPLNDRFISTQLQYGWSQHDTTAMKNAQIRGTNLRKAARDTWINAVIVTGGPRVDSILDADRGWYSAFWKGQKFHVKRYEGAGAMQIGSFRFLEHWGAASAIICSTSCSNTSTWPWRNCTKMFNIPAEPAKALNFCGSFNTMWISKNLEYRWNPDVVSFDSYNKNYKVWPPTSVYDYENCEPAVTSGTNCDCPELNNKINAISHQCGPYFPPGTYNISAIALDPPAIGTAASRARTNDWRRYYGN